MMEDHYQNQTSKSKFEKILTNFVCVRSLIQIKIFKKSRKKIILVSLVKKWKILVKNHDGGPLSKSNFKIKI